MRGRERAREIGWERERERERERVMREREREYLYMPYSQYIESTEKFSVYPVQLPI